MLPSLIKLNIIKFAHIRNDQIVLNLSNIKFKLIRLSKPTEMNNISNNELKKMFLKNQQYLIMSTNIGVVTHNEALIKGVGGKVLLAILKQ